MSTLGSGRGIHTKRGNITTNATTAIAPNPETDSGAGTIYIQYVQIWVTVAGTTSQIVVQSHTTNAVLGVGDTTKVGVALDLNATRSEENTFGINVPVGEGVDLVTTGGAAATLSYEIIYRVA